MIRPDVVALHKYCRVSPHSLEALRSGLFWFAKPDTFNDPFDCTINVSDDTLLESVQHVLQRAVAKPGYVPGSLNLSPDLTPDDLATFTEFKARIAKQFSEIGIFCLSEIWDDILMWSHYADSHRGFGVGFVRESGNPLGDDASPVRYQTDYPRLSVADFEPALHPDSIDQIWLVKAQNWHYEKEWRIFRRHGNQACSLYSPVASVVFGASCTDENKLRIREAVADSVQPSFYQASKAKSAFALQIELLPTAR